MIFVPFARVTKISVSVRLLIMAEMFTTIIFSTTEFLTFTVISLPFTRIVPVSLFISAVMPVPSRIMISAFGLEMI